MRILVVDGQGGGLGKTIVEKLQPLLRRDDVLLALGTNALATAAMLKAGASAGATGENPIIYNAPKADVIVGAMGVIIPNSMLGELTPAMALAIAASSAEKVLVPLNRCGVQIAGVPEDVPVALLIQDAIARIARLMERERDGRAASVKEARE